MQNVKNCSVAFILMIWDAFKNTLAFDIIAC